MKQSKELTKFYQDYSNWLNKGAPDLDPFNRGTGLCSNLKLYYQYDKNRIKAVLKGLHGQLLKDFDDHVSPFNSDFAYEDYEFESTNKECHLNPKRVEWVKSKIKEKQNG